MRLNPALTNQYIPVVIQNNPYTRNESVEFYQTTASSTNVVISFPNNLPVGERAPILLWMHGNSYYGEYYIKTMEIAASHGIAMVAPNYLAWSVGTGLVQQRVQLLKQALDLAYSLNQNASSPLFNKLDVTSGYVIGGHSWGGATASLYSLTTAKESVDPSSWMK
jgi:enterochelin esterase-like enzyme